MLLQWNKQSKKKCVFQSNLINYNVYKINLYYKIIYLLGSGFVLYIIGYVFYRSLVLPIILIPLAYLFLKHKEVDLLRKRKSKLRQQFKDMLYSIAASINSGNSIEMAFSNLESDLLIEYDNNNEMIITEVKIIVAKTQINETIESALMDFSIRSGIDDIRNFTDVFCTCRKLGGDVSEIINNSIGIINEKIEIYNEIDTILASKKFEQKILLSMPFIMIILFDKIANDYMSPFYKTLEGRIASSIMLIFIIISYYISEKIIDIKI